MATEEEQKKWKVFIDKTTNFHVHHAIVHVSLPSLHPCNMKLHILALWSRWTQHKSCLFPLLNLDTVLSDSTLENSANIFQMKWNGIRSMKFEAVRIHFLSDIFGYLSSKSVATMATWRKLTSPLYNPRYKTPLKLCPDCMTMLWMRNPLTPSAKEYIIPYQLKQKGNKKRFHLVKVTVGWLKCIENWKKGENRVSS